MDTINRGNSCKDKERFESDEAGNQSSIGWNLKIPQIISIRHWEVIKKSSCLRLCEAERAFQNS